MHSHLLAFVEAATGALGLEGPAFEFGVSSPGQRDFGTGPSGGSAEIGYVAARSPEETRTNRLEDPSRLPFPDGQANTVICIDTIQYAADPIRTAREMTRVLAPGGTFVLGSSVDPDAPDPPGRFWRPTHEMLGVMMGGLEATLIGWQGPERRAHTLFGIGVKSPASADFAPKANRFMADFQSRLDKLAAKKRARPILRSLTALCRIGPRAKRRPSDYYQSNFVLHLPVGREFKQELLSSCLPDEQTGTRIDLGG